MRRGELRDSVGDPPVRNPENWVGRVNPDNLRGPQYQMNCAEVSRRVSDILNGDTPDLAAGRTMAAGENPEGTLEWMDLENFPPENQMALRGLEPSAV